MTNRKMKLVSTDSATKNNIENKANIDSNEKITMHASDEVLTKEELNNLSSTKEFFGLLRKKDFNHIKLKQISEYNEQLRSLQSELVKLQRWVQETQKRVAIIFEGRDAAGKGGAIRRFVEHLSPRAMRIVALPKPSDDEIGQWYFQRYTKQLPNKGEIVFFDRSWYNRAVVEPVNKFCTKKEYEQFMRQVPEFEHMLYEDGIDLVKFWFSISKKEQLKRFESRKSNPLKQWKVSSIDKVAQDLWDDYTKYKEIMFSKTHTTFSPWIIVKANNKKLARLESMRYVLSNFEYHEKDDELSQKTDPNIIMRYYRSSKSID